MAGLLGSFKVAISPEVVKDGSVGKAVGAEIDGIEGAISKKGGIGGKIGKGLAAGAAAGVTALGGLTVAAVKSTADIEQSLGGADAVFDKSSGKIKEWAASASGNMGVSTNAALETANKMGALFQGMGVEQAKSAEMTTTMAQRAADVASVMGISLEEAMRSIEGAAKGNFTMMDNLGVPMTNASLQAYALSKGIDESVQSMDQATKIGLAYDMFMEKTAYAQGNFVKENTTLAGSLDILKSSWESVLQASGQGGDMLSSAISNLGSGIKNFLGAIIEALPPIIEGLTQALGELLPEVLNQVVTALPEILGALLDGVVGMLPALIDGLVQLIQTIIEILPDLIMRIVEALIAALPVLIAGLLTLITGLIEAIPELINGLVAMGPMIVQKIVEMIPSQLPMIFEALFALFQALIGLVPQLFAAYSDMIPQMVQMMVDLFNKLAPNFGQGVANFFAELPRKLGEAIGNALTALWNAITQIVVAFPQRAGEFFQGVAKFFAGLPQLAMQAGQQLLDAFRAIPGQLMDIGKWIIQGLIDGMGAMWSNLMGTISDFVGGIVDGFKEGLGIHSPSRLMRDLIGMNMGIGLGDGLLNSTRTVLHDISDFNRRILGGFSTDAALGVAFGAEAGAVGGGTVYNTTVNQQIPKSDSALDIYLASKRGAGAGSPPPSR